MDVRSNLKNGRIVAGMNRRKRLLALLLSLAMIVTYMPAIAFAATGDGDGDGGEPAVQQQAVTEENISNGNGSDAENGKTGGQRVRLRGNSPGEGDPEEGGSEDTKEISELFFDGTKNGDGDGEEWAHLYSVDGQKGTISIEDMNVSIKDENGDIVDAQAYDIEVRRTWYDNDAEEDRDESVDTGEGIGIYEDDKTEDCGFTQYEFIVTGKEDEGYTGEIKGNFYVADKYSLNFVCSELSFDEDSGVVESLGWRMHQRFYFGFDGVKKDPVVKGEGASEVLTKDEHYTLKYFERYSDGFDEDGRFDVSEEEAEPAAPGRYIARIEGLYPYYGGSEVMIDAGGVFLVEEGAPSLWSDGSKTYRVIKTVDGDVHFKLGAGYWNDEGFVWDDERMLDDEDYSFEDDNLTISGENAFNKIGADDLWIFAWVGDEENPVAQTHANTDVREAVVITDYTVNFPDDDELLPGWEYSINREQNVWVSTSDGSGYDDSIEIDHIDIAEGTSEDEDGELIADWEEENNGWNVKISDKAEVGDEVKIALHYNDRFDNDEEKVHIMTLTVRDEFYRVNTWVNGSFEDLPEGHVDVEAEVWHYGKEVEDGNENVTETAEIDWSLLKDGGSASAFGSIEPYEDEPWKARVTFKSLDDMQEVLNFQNESGYFREEFEARATVTTESGNSYYNGTTVCLNSAFDTIYDIENDSFGLDALKGLKLGESRTVRLQLRNYSAYPGEGYNNGYAVRDDDENYNINYEWDFNDGFAVVKDNEDGSWTVTRTGAWENGINVEAVWHEPDQSEDQEPERRRAGVGLNDCNIGLEEKEWLYDDRDQQVTLNIEGFSEDLYDDIDLEIGFYDGDTEEFFEQFKEDSILNSNQGDYSVELDRDKQKAVITIKQKTIEKALEVNESLFIKASCTTEVNGEARELLKESRWYDVRFSGMESYSIPESEEDWLIGDGRFISKGEQDSSLHIFNSDYPYEEWFDYSISSITQESGDSVDFKYTDGSGDDEAGPGWYLKAISEGDSTFTVTGTYSPWDEDGEKLDPVPFEYQFKIHAGRERFRINAYRSDSRKNYLPGETVEVRADWKYETSEDEEGEEQAGGEGENNDRNLHVIWEVQSKGEIFGYDRFASIVEDSVENGDGYSTASIRISDIPQGRRFLNKKVPVRAYLVDQEGDELNEANVVAWQMVDIQISNDYLEIEPVDHNRRLPVYATEEIKPELKRYYLDEDGNPHEENLSDKYDVRFEWPDDDDEQLEVDDSDFEDDGVLKLTRNRSYDFDFRLRAEWDDENDNYQSFETRYQYDELESCMDFDKYGFVIFKDLQKTGEVTLHTGDYGDDWQDVLEPVIIAGKYDYDSEKWITYLEEGEDYTLEPQENGDIKVIINESYINNAEEDSEIRIYAAMCRILGEDATIEDKLSEDNIAGETASVWVNIRTSGKEFEGEGEDEILPGDGGKIRGRDGVRIYDPEHPYGDYFPYYVTNVEIEDEDDVLGYWPEDVNTNDEYYEWNFGIKDRNDLPDDFAGADVRFTVHYMIPQMDEDGEPVKDAEPVETGTFDYTVHVVNDKYDVWLELEDNKDDALPGETLHMEANARHERFVEERDEANAIVRDEDGTIRWRKEDDADDLDFRWSYAFGSDLPEYMRDWDELDDDRWIPMNGTTMEDEERGSLEISKDGKNRDSRAEATAGALTQQDDEEFFVKAELLDSKGEATGKYESRRLLYHRHYTTIYPYELPDIEAGQTLKQTFEVREFKAGGFTEEEIAETDADGKINEDGSITRNDVRLKFFDVDDSSFEINELPNAVWTNGKKVSDGEFTYGNTFLIYRKDTNECDFSVYAYWNWNDDDDWYSDNTDQNYWFDNKEHWLDFEHERNEVFTDGTLDYYLNTDDFGENWSDRFDVKFTVGKGWREDDGSYTWEEDGLLGHKIFDEGEEYEVIEPGEENGWRTGVKLIGSKLAGYVDENDLLVVAQVTNKESDPDSSITSDTGVILASEDNWFGVVEPDFDLPQKDEYMMVGDGRTINEYVYYRGGKGPDVENERDVHVTDVKVNGDSVVLADTDEGTDPRTNWDLRAVADGDSTVTVTYTDPYDGSENNKYIFTMHVMSDLYEAYLDSVDGRFRVDPGESIHLKAYALHKIIVKNEDDDGWYYDESDKDLNFEWDYEVDPDTDLADVENLKDAVKLEEDPDHPGDSSRRVLSFADDEVLKGKRGGVTVKFRVLDENGQPVKNLINAGTGYQKTDWMFDYYGVEDEYRYVTPATLTDPGMDRNDSEIVDLSIWLKTPEREEDWLIPGEFEYTWYFDEGDRNDPYDGDVVIDEVIEKEGQETEYNRIHSGDQTRSTKFRITRRTAGYARLVLSADGGMMRSWHAYYLDPKDYVIKAEGYEDRDIEVESGEDKSFAVTLEGFKEGTKFESKLTSYDRDSDDFIDIEDLPVGAVTMTEPTTGSGGTKTATVTVSADAIEAIAEKGMNDFHVTVYAYKNDEGEPDAFWAEHLHCTFPGELPEFYAVASDGKEYRDGDTLSIEQGKKVFVNFVGDGNGYVVGWHDTIPKVDDQGNPVTDTEGNPVMTGDLTDAGFIVTSGFSSDLGYEGDNRFGIEIEVPADMPADTEQALTYSLHAYNGNNLEQDLANGNFSWDNTAVASHTLKVKVLAHEHDYGTEIPQVDATCTTDGVAAHYECSVCHDKFVKQGNEYIKKTDAELKIPGGHDYGDEIAKVNATCKADGMKAYYKCSVCEKLFVKENGQYMKKTADELKLQDPNAHVWDNGNVTTPATATADGVMTYKCTLCGATKNTVIQRTEEYVPEETTLLTPGVNVSDGTAVVGNITKQDLANVDTDKPVAIDATGAGGAGADVNSVVLSKASVENLADSNVKAVDINMGSTTAIIDSAVLNSLSQNAQGDSVTLNVRKDAEAEASMNDNQLAAIQGMANAMVIDAFFESNGEKISSNLGGGEVTLLVEYASMMSVRGWYVAEDGSKTEVSCTKMVNMVMMILTHTSHYVIEEYEEIIDTPEPTPTPQPQPTPQPTPTVKKLANTLTAVKKSPVTVKFSKLKKAKQTVLKNKMMKISKAQGSVTYKIVKANKKKNYFTINSRTGKLTIRKGLKKGKYTIKIAVRAAGNSKYEARTRNVTVTIKVK